MIQMRCIKLIELVRYFPNAPVAFAATTIDDVYVWSEDEDGEGHIVDDNGNIHYMPSPRDERDVDGWATSDYFEEI